jgi:hypothetical protein
MNSEHIGDTLASDMGSNRRTKGPVAARGAHSGAKGASRTARATRVPEDDEEHYRVLHHVPGRLRLIVPGLRRAGRAELEMLARELKSELIPGKVLAVTANPFTGSVTLTYDAAAIDILSWVEALLRREDVSRVLRRDAS